MDVLPEFFRTSQRKLDEGRNSPAINVFSELAVQAWRPKNKNENSVPAEMFIKTARMNEQKTKNKKQISEFWRVAGWGAPFSLLAKRRFHHF